MKPTINGLQKFLVLLYSQLSHSGRIAAILLLIIIPSIRIKASGHTRPNEVMNGKTMAVETIKISSLKLFKVQPNTLIQNIIGKVQSAETNLPLQGVTIRVKGTSIGTATDNNGNFELNNVSPDAILVVTSIGYETQEISVNNQAHIEIKMKPSVSSLNEVVVVGYGTEKKSDVIGSVSQITSKDIEKLPVTQLSNALTGQMPGVTVIQRSGRPGNNGAGDISIRGVGSFGADANPLILVDGVPTASFNDVDPNDVASISVLKDASSAAIYGARAANGVILVTTKGGQQGKLSVTYNSYIGFQKPTTLPKLAPSWQYAELYNDALGYEAYSPDQIQKYKDGSDPDNYPNSNFIKSTFSADGLQTGHNLSLSGGSEKSQYRVSLGYLHQDGIVPKNYYNRYSLRLNLVNHITRNLTLTSRVSGIQTMVKEPAPPGNTNRTDMSGIVSQSVRMPAVYAGKLSNGDFGVGPESSGTPVSDLAGASFFQSREMDITANLRLDWDAIPDLKLSLITAYDEDNEADKRFLASQQLNANILVGPSELTQNTNYTPYKTLQGLAEYNKQIKDHQFSLLLGYSFEDHHTELVTAYRDNFPGNDLTQLDVGSATNQQASGSGNDWALQSLFGRLKYNYNNKYLLEADMRNDGSSRFPPNHKYALFPSLALGWRLSKEKFISDNNNLDWITDLKLHASIGVLGNQNISNYPYQNVLNVGYDYPFGGTVSQGVQRTNIADSTLHWESTRTKDIGLDISVFSGRLNAGITYFDRYTYDILFSPAASVSQVLGFGLSQQNTGKLQNRGWEFTLGYHDKKGAFSYSITSNFSIINNEVLDLGVGNIKQPNGSVGNGSTLFIGYPMDLYYGYVADKIFTSADEIANWPDMAKVNPSPVPGDIRYKDISGPDGKPDGKVDPTYDRVVLGSTIPKYTYGLSFNIGYKGFDLGALVQGVSHVNGQLTNYAGYAFYNTASIQQWMADEHWSPEHPDANAKYPRLELIPNSGTPNTVTSSFWILNASYLKVRNVQLGYTLPANMLKRNGISQLRFYVSAENPLTWSKYRAGWDPEINTAGGYYPILANYTFGINLTL